MSTDEAKRECCKKNDSSSKDPKTTLVKATDLPRHGNPYPPKDVISSETPSLLERKIHSVRTSISPYTQPIGVFYERASDFAATGYAHSSSAIHRLSESQNSIVNAMIISGSGLFGALLFKRRRVLFGSLFTLGAIAACYPKDAEIKLQQMWYIAKNKLPVVAKQQYDKLIKGKEESKQTNVDASK